MSSHQGNSGMLVNPQKVIISRFNSQQFNSSFYPVGAVQRDQGSLDSVTLFIKVYPWGDTQQIEISDLNIDVGDIPVFFKEKGTIIKIRDLRNYSLYKILETRGEGEHPLGSLSESDNEALRLEKKMKKRLVLSNDQSLLSYNIRDQQRLKLIQNANRKSGSETLPRWYYKVIVPSTQLEGILKEINSDGSQNQHHHHHRHNHEKFEKLNPLSSSLPTSSSTESFQVLNQTSNPNINDIIENIKSNRLLTIDSPKRVLSNSSHTMAISNPSSTAISSSAASYSTSMPSKESNASGTAKWSKATPTPVPIRKNSLLDHDYDHSLLQYSSNISPGLEWLHARKVYDVVCKIESDFPNLLDSRLMEANLVGGGEDKWESRISSSEDTFIKSLTMEDTLGSEIVKQEYIEFSLRFENRTAIMMGIEYSFVIWIDPIQSFFTLVCSANATVRDVYFLILQYLFPTETSNINPSKAYEAETFSLMSPYFGLYLQESSTSKLIPLQHKQLLINCQINESFDSLFIFKRNKKTINLKNNNSASTNATSSNPYQLNTSNSSVNISSLMNSQKNLIDEDEGYNLTVLFPTHQTYRQFHFIPTRTVNETIQTIVSSTTKSLTFKHKPNSNGSNGSSGPNNNSNDQNSPSNFNVNNSNSNNYSNNYDEKNSVFYNSSVKSILSFSPTLLNSSNGKVSNTSATLNNSNNNLFENLDETSGFCLYFQRDGSGVWMEGNRRLSSYNLPSETVVEFKPPPNVCKLALIEGYNHTMKLCCKEKVYFIIYGRFTLISQLEDLIRKTIEPGNEKEFEFFGLFLTRGQNQIFISNHLTFHDVELEHGTIIASDFVEFKSSSGTTIDSVLKDAALAFANAKDPILLPGEIQVMKRDGERVVNDQHKKGCFILTNYRIIFTALNRSSYDDLTKDDIEITNTSIMKIKQSSNLITEIHTKDLKFCLFYCYDITIWSNLKNLVEVPNISKTFAFYNQEIYDKSLDTIYNPFDEFQRLQFPLDKWRITHINNDYSLCPTYPSLFVVPTSIKDEDLKKIANFREKGRVPAICWIHKNHNSTITRCSQPRVGLSRSRCSEDEEYLKVIKQCNSNSHILYVMDSRPMANAKANTLLGKGHENTSLYQNVELKFLGIGNIHVMRDSFKKLCNVLQSPETDNWLPLIDSTQWLEHIYQLINSANMVVELVDKKGASVLTHCSDGWDRTSQLVSLSQLLLDPYYRTIRGFQILIEKEWLSFGHLFTTRNGHIFGPNGDDEFSPIFLMFIDSVWQLTCLLPTTFEFNEAFLIKIMDAVYSCRYKQFLFNNERERVFYSRHTNLVSLWPSINSTPETYTNYFYIKNPKPIYENFFMCDIQFWSNYYLRWNSKFKPKLQIDYKILKEIEDVRARKERKRQTKLQQSKSIDQQQDSYKL